MTIWRRHCEHIPGDLDVNVVNPWSVDENFEYLNMDESRYLGQVQDAFPGFDCDIMGVSAGFGTYLEDWGGLLRIKTARKWARSSGNSKETCGDRGLLCWRADIIQI